MAIPVNVTELIYGQRIESPRLEFKKGWNPERVLHTICAFANDIDEWGGGYIVVGVEVESDVPKIIGLDRSTIDDMQKELVGMANLIEPRYMPSVEISEIDSKAVMTIWVTAGDRRPYSCPVKYSKSRKDGERGYYIRKMSSTIRTNRDDERRLFEVSRMKSFDMCINYDAKVQDLRQTRIRDYLYRVGSSLYGRSTIMPLELLCKEMRIVSGPDEDLKPLNIGVLFFTDNPEQFLVGAYVDVVYKPVPTGEGMEEYHVTGPLDIQIVNAMSIITRYIGNKIYKPLTGLEAKKVSSYPVKALRELLVNAVYHKSYEMLEPVRVTITPTSIEFLNYPGPSTSLSDEEIRNNQLTVGTYRNIRVGEYLRELDLAESRFTGIPEVVRSLAENGSPPLKIITDPGRTYFKAILGIHPDFVKTDVAGENLSVEDKIVSFLSTHGCMKMIEISSELGYKGINSTVRSAVAKLMSEGKVEYLYPDAPRSPKQRICLTSDKKL